MLQGKIEGDLRWQQGHMRGSSFCSRWTRALISLDRVAARHVRCWRILYRGRRQNRLSCQVSAFFIVPRRFVVRLRLRIKAGVQSVIRKLESLLNDERRFGVIDEIVVGEAVFLERVINPPAEKGD